MFPEADNSDGLGAAMLRLGGAMSMQGENPADTGGQYYLVFGGGLELDGATYEPQSMIYIAPEDTPLSIRAGARGLEIMMLSFPRRT